ncbi:hypothetical protein Tco_0669183 [Tanacetum coccineum]
MRMILWRVKQQKESLGESKFNDGNAFWNEIGVNAGVSKLIYALTVNPTIYTSCIKQLWATAKVQTVNEEVQIQALVDGKKVIVTEIKLERIGVLPWNIQNTSHATESANGRRSVKKLEEEQGGPKNYKPRSDNDYAGKQSRRKQRKDSGPTKPITDEATNEEHVSTPSYDPSQSGEDRMQLNELMDLYAKLSDRVLALENTNTSQAAKIATLKERVKKLEKKRRSRTYKPRRLYKVSLSRRIKSSDDASLGAQEDASKQGRKIVDLDADTEVTLIDETQGRNNKDLMFDIGVLNGDEVFQELIVNSDTTTKSSIPVSAADPITTTGKEDQAPASTPIVSPSQLPQAKDKGKAKMVDPEKPLKKKDQIAIDEEVARNLEAQLQAESEEEESLSRQKEKEANIALI